MDHDFVYDSEPEREAVRLAKAERRAAARAAKRLGRGSGGESGSTSLDGSLEDVESATEASSSRPVVEQETRSSYFGKKSSRDQIDPQPAMGAASPAHSIASSTSSGRSFRAPSIRRLSGSTVNRDRIHSHPPTQPAPMTTSPRPLTRPVPKVKALPGADMEVKIGRSSAAMDVQMLSDADEAVKVKVDKGKSRATMLTKSLPSDCPFDRTQLTKLKECVLCLEEWQGTRKSYMAKWAHLEECRSTTLTSRYELVRLVQDHLVPSKKASRPSKSLLSKNAASSSRSVSEPTERSADAETHVVQLSDSEEEKDARATPSAVDTPFKYAIVDLIGPQSVSPFRTPSSTSSVPNRQLGSASPAQPRKIDFDQFRYVASGAPLTSKSTRRAPSTFALAATPAIPVSDCPLSGVAMKKLSSCVVCGEDWLKRKKPLKERWPHTYLCSQALDTPCSLDRLQAMMEDEITRLNPPPALPSLLDAALPHHKKPTRKRSVIQTSVFAAGSDLSRAAILERAGQILEGPKSDELMPPPFLATQGFSTSALGSEIGSGRGLAQAGEPGWVAGLEVEDAGRAQASRLTDDETELHKDSSSLALPSRPSLPSVASSSSSDSVIIVSANASSALLFPPKILPPNRHQKRQSLAERPSGSSAQTLAEELFGDDEDSSTSQEPSRQQQHTMRHDDPHHAHNDPDDINPRTEPLSFSTSPTSRKASVATLARPPSPDLEIIDDPSPGPSQSFHRPHSPTPEYDDDEGVIHWEGDVGFEEYLQGREDVSDDSDSSDTPLSQPAHRRVERAPSSELDDGPEDFSEAFEAVTSSSKPAQCPKSTPRASKTSKRGPAMPDYESMTVKQLQTKLKPFGLKPSSQHAQLVRLLTQIWQTMHPTEQDGPPSPVKKAVVSPPKKKKKGATRNTPPRTAAWSASDSESSSAGDDLESRFRAMIVEDEDVWLRVLRFEPVSFDEIVSLGHEANIKTKGWRNLLKIWLDNQSITYFTEEQTGSRQRYP